MAFLDHIRTCNAWDPAGFRPLFLGTRRIGWVRHDNADALADFPAVFAVSADAVRLAPHLDTPERRTAAVAEVMERLAERGTLKRLRHEPYGVKTLWQGPELFRIDRAAVPFLGLKAFGVHMNGFVRHRDGSHGLWIGRRSPDKAVAPNKLDNIVAGGQPAGLTLRANLLKEAAEEAGMPEELASRAISTGAITYCFADETGLKPDTMYTFDLNLPEEFVPVNTDGEIAEFMLWPVERVLETVRDTDEFKFNVNLVIIDFAIRHGLIVPDEEPSYELLLRGLRREHPGFD